MMNILIAVLLCFTQFAGYLPARALTGPRMILLAGPRDQRLNFWTAGYI